jgi:hypothetical protein
VASEGISAEDCYQANINFTKPYMIIYSHYVPPPAWTARSLVNRIFSLLHEHPIFALPVVAADLLSFAAMHIQHALHQPLFDWVFTNKDSVLATTRSAFVLTPQNATKAALLTLPLIWGCYFLTVCLYTGALLISSSFVRRVARGELPDLRSALVDVIRNRRRLLFFSISLLGALIIAAIVAGFLIAASMKVPWLASKMGRDFGYLTALPLELVLAYLFIRPALKLLSETQASNVQVIERMAIFLSLITVITQVALVLLIEHAAPAFLFQQKTIIGFLIREAVVSLIGALPYVPLFIGLSLLSAGSEHLTSARGLEEVEGP